MKDYKFGEVYEGRIPKEQAEKFAILWGEGSPNLKNLIQYCILNDIKTTASCKGHKSTDKPYISFKMDEKFCKASKQSLSEILSEGKNFLNSIFMNKNVSETEKEGIEK